MEGSRRLRARTFEETLRRAFIEVFKPPQVKQFIEEKRPALIHAGFNG
jgi:hypothetical protein